MTYQARRRFPEAIEAYQQLIAARPDFAEAYDHLGVALSLEGSHEKAADAFKQSLALAPENPSTQGNLGIALCHLKQFEPAAAMLRAALIHLPQNPNFHAALGTVLFFTREYEASADACRQATALAPARGDAHLTLSAALNALQRHLEALPPAQRAVELLPHVIDVHINLAETYRNLGKPDDTITILRNALQLHPQSPQIFNSLGNILKDVGELDEAVHMYRQSLTLRPDPSTHSNLLYTLQYHPTIDLSTVYQHHREFNRLYAEPLAAHALPHSNDPAPTRRLRVGYVSTEFRSHALGHYITPLLANHDKSAFEIFSYVDLRIEDATTALLKQHSDHWKSIRHLTDEEVAKLIRADGIDLLIDLHQHMGGNRILVYARKSAPVQIAFAGYPGTTGLSMIDYRLTDRNLEPPDGFPVPSSENPILLPDTFWCYLPRASMVPVTPLPAEQRKKISFGNFNNFCKVNEPTLALWAKVLLAVPHSTLTLLAPEGAHRARTTAFLQTQGIDPARITFVPHQIGAAYFELYHHIDIGLDTFPYNGHTTSLDSFFMGVPVITLVGPEGNSPVSRAGWSQLVNLNLPELAALSREEFVTIAATLANDLPRLAALRASLRSRMIASPLTDGPRFARNVEAAYRLAWERWCRKQGK